MSEFKDEMVIGGEGCSKVGFQSWRLEAGVSQIDG